MGCRERHVIVFGVSVFQSHTFSSFVSHDCSLFVSLYDSSESLLDCTRGKSVGVARSRSVQPHTGKQLSPPPPLLCVITQAGRFL